MPARLPHAMLAGLLALAGCADYGGPIDSAKQHGDCVGRISTKIGGSPEQAASYCDCYIAELQSRGITTARFADTAENNRAAGDADLKCGKKVFPDLYTTAARPGR